jgi:hypothetical protein
MVRFSPLNRPGRSAVSEYGWEAATAGALFVCFLGFVFAYPGAVDLYLFRAGLGYSQAMAANLAALLQTESISELWRRGAFPGHWESYQGILMMLAFTPFQMVLGSPIWLYEYWHLLFVIPAMLFSYFTLRAVFGRYVALLFLFLLVVHPGFVSGVRMGAETGAHMLFFTTGAAFLAAAAARGRSGCILLAAVSLAMGMSVKLWFHWLLIGTSAAVLIFRKDCARVFRQGHRVSFGLLGGTLALLAAGIWLAEPGRIFVYEDPVVSIPAILRQFASAFAHANAVWASSVFRGNELFLTYRFLHPNPVFPIFLWASAVFLAWRHFPNGKRFLIFPLLLALWAFLPPIPNDRMPETYPFFFYPLPQIVLAAAAAEAWRAGRKHRAAGVLLAGLAVLFAAGEIRGLRAYFGEIKGYGVPNERSRAFHELADWLRKNPSSGQTVVCHDSTAWEEHISRWRWTRTLPRTHVRFLFFHEDRELDVSYSLHEKPSDHLTFLFRPAAEKTWSAGIETWLAETRRGEPLARFVQQGELKYEVFSSAPPGRSAVTYSLIPDWDAWNRVVFR